MFWNIFSGCAPIQGAFLVTSILALVAVASLVRSL